MKKKKKPSSVADHQTLRQFATVWGSPGETPRVRGLLRVVWPFFLLAALAGYLLRAAVPVPVLSSTVIGVAFLGVAGLLAWTFMAGMERIESYIKGARGEERVARVLSLLPAEFHVYNGLGDHRDGSFWMASDYDHVVVGPTGLFLIETKCWNGRITVDDGHVLCNGGRPSRPPLEQVKEAARRLRGQLREDVHQELDVQPILCFAEGVLSNTATGAQGVIMCRLDTLASIVQDAEETVLSKGIQEKINVSLAQRFFT